MKRMNEEKLSEMERYIKDYIRDNNGESPKFSSIIAHMGMNNSVGYRYLTTLRDRGLIEYSGKETLSVAGQSRIRVEFSSVAVLGAIPCGLPEENEEMADGFVALPREWVEGECYLLRASGDSMVGVGIEDGDLVLIQKASQAKEGQIIAALVNGTDTTLKRYMKDGDKRVYLHVENPKYPDIYPAELVVQGIALKIIKDVR